MAARASAQLSRSPMEAGVLGCFTTPRMDRMAKSSKLLDPRLYQGFRVVFGPPAPFRTRKVTVFEVSLVDPGLVWEMDRVGVGDKEW